MGMHELPKRKHIRLPNYDYSQNGVYFVTICTEGRRNILSEIVSSVGRDDPGAPLATCLLSRNGEIVKGYIESIPRAHPGVTVEQYCIMPNHVHMLLAFYEAEERRAGSSRPTQRLPRIIAALKRFSNRDTGQKLWQIGYYEHIIRDNRDYLVHWQYIDQKPARWAEDEYNAEYPAGGNL